MTTERMSPLRRRMIEDMMVRGHGEKTKLDYIRAIKRFAAFLGRSPDSATAEDLRAWQLHMTETNVSVASFNQAIPAASAAAWTARLSWRVEIGVIGGRPGNSQPWGRTSCQ